MSPSTHLLLLLSQILPQPDVEMGTVPVPENVVALCEEPVDPPDKESFFDAAGEFYDHYTGEILDRDATIAGIRATQMQEFGVVRMESPRNHPLRSHQNENVPKSERRRGPVKNCGTRLR